jgi:hypothetical protein
MVGVSINFYSGQCLSAYCDSSMNLKKLIQDNWKGAVVGVAVTAAAAYGGPLAGKAAGFILPKALEHVSNTPVSDVLAHKSPVSRDVIAPENPKCPVVVRHKTTLKDVERDWGIKGKIPREVHG